MDAHLQLPRPTSVLYVDTRVKHLHPVLMAASPFSGACSSPRPPWPALQPRPWPLLPHTLMLPAPQLCMSRSFLRLTGPPTTGFSRGHTLIFPDSVQMPPPLCTLRPGQSWARGPSGRRCGTRFCPSTGHSQGRHPGRTSAALPVNSPRAGPGSSEVEAPAPSTTAPSPHAQSAE